jgi:hypothetical protein
MGTQHPTIVAAVLLVLGVALLALTLRAPPYFGDLSQKPKSESSKNQMWVLRSLPNRLRCSADSALVWIYLCTFLACAAQGTDSDMMLLVLPACVVLWLLAGYWLPSALDRREKGRGNSGKSVKKRNALANFRRLGNKVKTQLSVQRKMKGLVHLPSPHFLEAYVQSMDQMREVAKELDNETTSSTIAEEDHTPRNALAIFRRSGNKVKTQLSVQRKMKGLVQGARASTSTDFMDPRHTTGDSTSTGWTNPGSPNHPSMRVLGAAAMFAAGPSDTYHKPGRAARGHPAQTAPPQVPAPEATRASGSDEESTNQGTQPSAKGATER